MNISDCCNKTLSGHGFAGCLVPALRHHRDWKVIGIYTRARYRPVTVPDELPCAANFGSQPHGTTNAARIYGTALGMIPLDLGNGHIHRACIRPMLGHESRLHRSKNCRCLIYCWGWCQNRHGRTDRHYLRGTLRCGYRDHRGLCRNKFVLLPRIKPSCTNKRQYYDHDQDCFRTHMFPPAPTLVPLYHKINLCAGCDTMLI